MYEFMHCTYHPRMVVLSLHFNVYIALVDEGWPEETLSIHDPVLMLADNRERIFSRSQWRRCLRSYERYVIASRESVVKTHLQPYSKALRLPSTGTSTSSGGAGEPTGILEDASKRALAYQRDVFSSRGRRNSEPIRNTPMAQAPPRRANIGRGRGSSGSVAQDSEESKLLLSIFSVYYSGMDCLYLFA
jgi:hypothetical protein